MLTAKLKNGEVISLIDNYSRSQLQELRNKESFYCRTCSAKVILKLGTKKIFHFAHESGTECTEYYERESEYHTTGKIHLYEWLKSKHVNPELEYYFPTIKQRADIVFIFEGKTYCIEFQCSTISEETFRKRTEGYLKLSHIPIWILGGKNINRLGPHKTTLSSFHYLFLRESSAGLGYLLSYCPQAHQFISLESIIPVSVKKAYCRFSLKPPHALAIQDIVEPNISLLKNLDDWRTDLSRFKTTFLTNANPITDPFLNELYCCSLNPYLIPPFVGIPLRMNYAIETPPFVWQAYIFLDHIFGQKEGTEVHFHHVYVEFLRRVKRLEIQIRNLPCLKRNPLPFAIEEYLAVLTKVGVLKKIKNKKYLIDKSIKIANNIEEWQQQEIACYEKIFGGFRILR